MKTLNAGWSKALAETIKTFSAVVGALPSRTTLARDEDSLVYYDATDNSLKRILVSNLPKRDSNRLVTADYSAVSTDEVILVDAFNGAVTITLPRVSTVNGQLLRIKKVDSSANAVTVDGYGAERIDGQTAQQILFQYDSMTLTARNTWHIV